MRALLVSIAGLVGVWGTAAAAPPVDYAKDVKPILRKNCYGCHGPQKQRSGLRLDTATAALKGGNSGPAIIPGKSGKSTLIKAVTGSDEAVKQMPPKEPRLTAVQIAMLRAWIDQGAKAPANEIADASSSKDGHWAFRPPVRSLEPKVKNAAWVRNPIDSFILARLEKEGIAPAPEADRVTLIRRLSLDLLGLPPSIKDVSDFLADKRADAYERLVDRLLDSPHFGERWGRHWLDAARYADSNGFTIDSPRTVWPYRDWVIKAFNKDMPFDRFTIEQVAGDMLPNATLEQKIATGFHRNTLKNEEGGIDLEQFRVEYVVDRVNTTGTVFLGLTIGCCQCHDHKFDPITQKEFYQFFAFLNNAEEPTLELATPEQRKIRDRIHGELSRWEKRRKPIDFTTEDEEKKWEERLSPAMRAEFPKSIQAILAIPENARDAKQKRTIMTAYRQLDMVRHLAGGIGNPLPFAAAAHSNALLVRTEAEKQINELADRDPDIITTLVMEERKTPRETHVHIKGDFTRKGARVYPGVPEVMHLLSKPGPLGTGLGPNRLDLAKWLVDPANPLTPRVVMNRFWQQLFGLGIVETENDFGTQGTPPSHPELLDWLATEFTARRWSMKSMVRLMVTSAVYRQSSKHRPELATADPRNKLLARQSRLRLDAEIIRDMALATSGLLNPKIGGPSVFPPQPEGVYTFTQINKNWKAATGPDRYRRGMYTYFWRSAPHPVLTVFDAPDGTGTCTRRNRSNTPLQALTLLNDQAYVEFAQGLAARVIKESEPSDSMRIRRAFQLCLARPPRAFEETRLARLLEEQRAGFDRAPKDAKLIAGSQVPKNLDPKQFAAWTAVARVLLNLDEFITRE